MRILQLIQKPQLRGAEIFAANLCTHLQRQGEDVLLVSIFKGNAPLPFDGPTVHLQADFTRRFFDLRSWFKLSKIIKRFKPDIIQANSGFTLKFAVFSRWIFRWKQPIVFRNASTMSLYIHSAASRIFNALFLDQAVAVASVSTVSANDIGDLYPFLSNRTIRIPTGIEAFDLPKITRDPSWFTLIHVGGFTFEKNHEALLEIFSRVALQVPNARLWLVGDGPLRRSIEEKAEKLGIASRITFYGYVGHVVQLLRSADLLVSTSIIEGLPAAILEAFYCRVPVVSFDAGGISEIVHDRTTGRLITQGDMDAFVEAIISAYRNAEGRYYVENAFQRVTSAYMNDIVAREFRNLYNNLIQMPASGALALQNKI